MATDFDAEIERRGTHSYKWDDNHRLFGRADLLPFWVADMDFATPQPILDAIRSRCEHPVLGYGIRSGEYFAAISDWLKSRHGWSVPHEWMTFCPPSSIVGIHGVVAYQVAQRTREIGLRMALGAARSTVLREVLRRAAVIAVAGVVLGAAGAAATTRVMQSLLVDVSPLDPVTFGGTSSILFAVALFAATIPAVRAASMDPAGALRND